MAEVSSNGDIIWKSENCANSHCFICDQGPRDTDDGSNEKNNFTATEIVGIVCGCLLLIVGIIFGIKWCLDEKQKYTQVIPSADEKQLQQEEQERESGDDHERRKHEYNSVHSEYGSNSYGSNAFQAAVYNANVTEMRTHATGQVNASSKVLYLKEKHGQSKHNVR